MHSYKYFKHSINIFLHLIYSRWNCHWVPYKGQQWYLLGQTWYSGWGYGMQLLAIHENWCAMQTHIHSTKVFRETEDTNLSTTTKMDERGNKKSKWTWNKWCYEEYNGARRKQVIDIIIVGENDIMHWFGAGWQI